MKIALFGKMRSGKNTVADILSSQYNFKQYAFGTGIGEIIDKFYPNARANGKPRQHYQHIGQELRKLDEDVWINYLLKTISCDYVTQAFGSVWSKNIEFKAVVTDGRQVNEAEALREKGYIIVKVVAPDEVRLHRMSVLKDNMSPANLTHETELQLDSITADYTINNDGTYADLVEKVTELVNDIKNKEDETHAI